MMIWGSIKEGAKRAGIAFVTGKILNRRSGAKLQNVKELGSYLNVRNRGLLLNGADRRLSETDSFQNVCVIARVGAGKTTRYIIPNVLDRAQRNCSVVINDPKGEVFEATSGFMQSRGFQVIAINPENLKQSSCFNPLLEAKSDLEIEQLAEILVLAGAGKSSGNNQFWNDSATRLVSILLKILNRAGRANPAHNTLGNLYLLLQNFGSNGAPLDQFVIETLDPENPDDEGLWEEWSGFISSSPTTLSGIVQTALTALKAFTNQNLVKLTSSSSFDLESIRREKVAVYFITPPQMAEYYGFWTSLFFRSVFNASMRSLPTRRTLPLYILYDEFGHSTIPGFASIANTIRGYKVSLSIVLQSMAQLSTRYGKDYAQAIQGGLTTFMTYAGSDQETARHFEAVAGKVIEENFTGNTQHQRQEFNLLNADTVRRIEKSQVLLISSNQNPALLETLAFFENRHMRPIPKRYGAARITGAAAHVRPSRVHLP